LNRNPSLWSIITKCKEQIGKPNSNEKEEVKDSELPDSFVPVCNLKDGHVISELQSVESTAAPVCKVLQTGQQEPKNISQEIHARSTVQLKASELETSMRKGQLFVYVFSPATESWEMEQLVRAPHGQNISIPEPQISCLAHSLQGVIICEIYRYFEGSFLIFIFTKNYDCGGIRWSRHITHMGLIRNMYKIL
jgi:hypothetical protein